MAAAGARVKVKVKDVAGMEEAVEGGSMRRGWCMVDGVWQKERAATEHAMARTNVDIKLLAVAKADEAHLNSQ